MFIIHSVEDNILYFNCSTCKSDSKCIVKHLSTNVFITLTCPHCLNSANVLVTSKECRKNSNFSWSPLIQTELVEK